MIFYFSGTGNSRYVAERIARIIGDTPVSINDKIKQNDERKIESETLIFVVPTYAWRIPQIVADWILRTEFTAGKAWFVMTCGGQIGNAAEHNKNLCEQKHFTYMGTAQIVMPENYVALFGVPEWDEAKKIIAKAEPDILKAGEKIKNGSTFASHQSGLLGRLMSNFVNPLFCKFSIKADSFYAKDNCTGCGNCVAVCPLNNIELKNGKPTWGKSCTHCMACISYCPAEAIEYGKKSVGKLRYVCREN